MRICLLAGLALGGCYHPSVQANVACAEGDVCPEGLSCRGGLCVVPGGEDAAVPQDAPPVDGPERDGCASFSQQIDTCALPAGQDVVLDGGFYEYNTDNGHLDLYDAGGNVVSSTTPPGATVSGQAGPIHVMVATTFTLAAGSTLNVVGTDPFGIVSDGMVTITGRITAIGGAGARDETACGTSRGGGGNDSAGGGSGGGGGGFGAMGGRGGSTSMVAGGIRGVPVALPAGPLGGCPGGGGGAGTMAGSDGIGNLGGGAVFISSATMISVPLNAFINVGGMGGGGGGGVTGAVGYLAGGGGGGSGGMIWLEAPAIMIRGRLTANGGGGGEGSGVTAPGNNGGNGRTTTLAASGGNGADADGGDGGPGGVSMTSAVSGAGSTTGGGGGGGGGVGFIVLRGAADVTGATISPPAM